MIFGTLSMKEIKISTKEIIDLIPLINGLDIGALSNLRVNLFKIFRFSTYLFFFYFFFFDHLWK